MLQSFRNFSGSFFGRILFVALAACFAVLLSSEVGMNALMGKQDPVVVSVGSTKVTTRDLKKFLANMRTDIATINSYGQLGQVINKLAEEVLLDYEAQRLKITVSKDAVQAYIAEQFSRGGQKFSRGYFLQMIGSMGFSEYQYTHFIKKRICRELLIEMVMQGFFVPKDLVKKAAAFDQQNREIKIYKLGIDHKDVVVTKAPDAQELTIYYEQNKEKFRNAEYRSCDVIVYPMERINLKAQMRANDIDKLKKEYKLRKLDFAGQSFDEVKEKLRDSLKESIKADLQTQVERQIEDLLAGGESSENIAKALDIDIIEFNDFANNGTFKAGGEAENAALFEFASKQAYKIDNVDDYNELTTMKNGDYVIVKLTNIKSSVIPALNKIKKRVIKQWYLTKSFDNAKAKAMTWMQTINEGSKLIIDSAHDQGVVLINRGGQKLAERLSINPQKYGRELFELGDKKALIAQSANNDMVYLLQVNRIVHSDKQLNKKEIKKMRKIMSNVIAQDALTYYLNNLRMKYRVEYNNDTIGQLSKIQK